MIRFDSLRRKDFARVAHIEVAPEQIKFAGPVREAFATKEAGVDFHAILHTDHAIGFFKIDRHYAQKYRFCIADELGLRAFIINLSQQGRGFGTAAIRALPAYLRSTYPGAHSIALTVNHNNPVAKSAYLRGGFTATGETYPHGAAGPQDVLRLQIK